jgi:hypothetical protein
VYAQQPTLSEAEKEKQLAEQQALNQALGKAAESPGPTPEQQVKEVEVFINTMANEQARAHILGR